MEFFHGHYPPDPLFYLISGPPIYQRMNIQRMLTSSPKESFCHLMVVRTFDTLYWQFLTSPFFKLLPAYYGRFNFDPYSF